MMAVNIDVTMPSDNVTAKPLMGPVPNAKRTIAAISVVMFASAFLPYSFENQDGRIHGHTNRENDAGDAGES